MLAGNRLKSFPDASSQKTMTLVRYIFLSQYAKKSKNKKVELIPRIQDMHIIAFLDQNKT